MLIALAAAALVAGLAGAWSPCGFSMVETLAPHGYAQRMRVTAVACTTFAVGALAGAVATFGGLALLGATFGAGQGAAVAIAVALLLAAAAGDVAGRRIVPQVRRQVPESWRRVLPVPLAAALYGVLLGLGFTTFVLSFAVYALAAACVALGDSEAGLVVGIAFATGRILPVVACSRRCRRPRAGSTSPPQWPSGPACCARSALRARSRSASRRSCWRSAGCPPALRRRPC